MDVNDIMNRLRTGETLDDIAKDMTKALNEASSKYQEEKRKIEEERAKRLAEEKAKREAELASSLKRADAAQIAVLLNKFTAKYYNDLASDEITADHILELYDCMAMVLRNFQKVEEVIKPRVKDTSVDEFSEAIDEFLDKYVR